MHLYVPRMFMHRMFFSVLTREKDCIGKQNVGWVVRSASEQETATYGDHVVQSREKNETLSYKEYTPPKIALNAPTLWLCHCSRGTGDRELCGTHGNKSKSLSTQH